MAEVWCSEEEPGVDVKVRDLEEPEAAEEGGSFAGNFGGSFGGGPFGEERFFLTMVVADAGGQGSSPVEI